MSNFSVVMVSHHTGSVLYASVATVLKQKNLAELVIVDNANPPDVLARLRQWSLTEPRLKIITGYGNIGFAKASNIGVKSTTGYFVVLMNPDCLLPPDALSDLMTAFENQSDAVIAGCEIVNPNGSVNSDSVRFLLTPNSAIRSFFSLGRKPVVTAANGAACQVPAISGALLCIRRKDLNRLNGLDEEFFVRGACMDLCMRVHRFGGKIIYAPHIKVTRLSTNDESFKRVIEWQRAQGLVHYFRKHFDNRYPLGFMPFVRITLMARFMVKVAVQWLSRQLRPAYVMSHTIPSKRLMILASGLCDLPQGKELEGKTILVTGATSQVGLSVVRRLLASGAAVLAISRNDPIAFQHEHLRWIKGDLTDSHLHLDGYLVDMVVHCAPLWHLPPTVNLLADAEVKRIIAFGTTSVFGKILSKNYYERELVEKLARAESDIAERCSLHKIDWTILRPTMTYGAGLDLNVTSLAKLINFLSFFPVYLPAVGKRHPVHVDDLALAVMQVMNNPHTYKKSYNLSGGEVISYRDMLARIFTVIGKKLRIEDNTTLPFLLDMAGRITGKKHINGEIARRMNDDLMFFHDDAKRDFGFEPRPFLSGGIRDIEGY